MFKRIVLFVFSGFLLLSLCGCLALLVGGAAGAGTAVWLSDKLTQEFHASYERTIKAAETALASLNLQVTKETRAKEVTQIRSEYTDGKDIWIDIRKVAEKSTKVEVRVGALSPDKEAADKILKAIQARL